MARDFEWLTIKKIILLGEYNMKKFTKLVLVSSLAISANAMAMQAMDDASLGATTGQDGINIGIGISKIEIERAADRVKIVIFTAKPGVVIGKGGQEIEVTKKELAKLTDKKIMVDIKEIKRPDKDAQLVAENIALQLENRVSFRRAMKSCMSRTMKTGALGIKAACAGRLGGADMARTEFYSEGTIPLQTLRADIDYGFAEADTTYGKIGVKVWIYKGEVLPTKGNQMEGSDK